MLELKGKGKGVVTALEVAHVLSSEIVLEVSDVFTPAEPTNVILFVFLLRVNQNSHSFIEQTLRLDEVE